MHANKFTHSNTCIKKHKNQQNKVTHAMHPKQSKGFFHQQQQQQHSNKALKGFPSRGFPFQNYTKQFAINTQKLKR